MEIVMPKGHIIPPEGCIILPRPPQSRERINFRDERQTQSALTITLIPGIAARGRKVALASPASSFALPDCNTCACVADELPARAPSLI